MAITDKKTGPWGLDQVYNKINQGSIWDYTGQGHLYSWGNNTNGRLGVNSQTKYSSPIQIPGAWGPSSIVRVADGVYSVKTDGTLWTWGRNQARLGHNDTTARSSPVQVPGTTWSEPGTAGDSGACTKTDGTLWIWGLDYNGQLAQNNQTQYSSPKQIPGTTWSRVSGGDGWYIALKTDGTLWAWGENAQGQLGQNNKTQRSSPIQIPGTTWSDIGCQRDSSWAMKTDGTLWAWGKNTDGQLGQNNKTEYSSPRQVGSDTTWSKLGVFPPQSGAQCIATKTDGTLWVWGGAGDYGILCNGGVGDSFNRSSPVQIPGTNWSTTIRPHIESNCASAVKTDGTGWVWGRNDDGILGQNQPSNTHRSSPVQLPGTWLDLMVTSAASFGIKPG